MVDRLLGRAGHDGSGHDGHARGAVAEPAVPADPTAEVWQRVQFARNLRRPRTLELAHLIGEGFVELHGDRLFGDDAAMVCGIGRISGRRVVIIGQQKGADTEENIRRNFGMPHPEGYRKSMRLMELAERLRIPVVTFIDLPGAHPGPESEERGIAEAIAKSIALMSRLRVPIVAVITGEGGSGGALAIAVGDVVIALENAVYSVITPEGCASILWRTPDKASTAALAMRMTAADQAALGIVDIVVPEPTGGAHADHAETAARLRAVIIEQLAALESRPIEDVVAARFARYRTVGPYETVEPVAVAAPMARPGITDRVRTLLGSGRATLQNVVPSRRVDPGEGEEDDR